MNINFYATVFSVLFFFGLLQTPLAAQGSSYVTGDLLVQLRPDTEMADWLGQWNRQHDENHALYHPERASRPANIWLVHFDAEATELEDMIALAYRNEEVLAAQRNHRVKLRSIPSDALFGDQWQYNNTGQSGGTPGADIDAVAAWDITTGGTTLNGDTIVVAVLDNGIDDDHPDLINNRWLNHAEIPGNGIDDDNNGYTDDYRGWNILNDSDNVDGGGHGTAVAGIIGADGDNELGVTGVNWNVKVMIIRNNFNTTEAAVIEAYSYALEQRQRYNQSGGAEGAFVVATNASWGVDEGQPEDAPIWCDFYDILGQAGIINCGATVNENFNIEFTGDLPTACPSDYLIAVTNTDHNDIKEVDAGYGNISIDLAAPGTGVYNIANGGSYGTFGGTSSATPHVAGTAGLLYSLACPALMALVQADPAAAALLVKEAILEGVDPVANLSDITVTGGRLNVLNSINYMLEICDGCLPASSVQVSNLTDTQARINWNTNDSLESVDLRWRSVGAPTWTLLTDVQSPLILTSLQACNNYEYQLQSNCFSDVIPFQNSRFFKTDGCCDPPSDVNLFSSTNTTATLNWASVLAAQSYAFRYRRQGTTTWTEQLVSAPAISLVALETCGIYEYQIRTNCVGEMTDWTALNTFITRGCGPCLEEDYCIRENVLSTTGEFIERVEIGGFFSNSSDGAANGYQDFGGLLVAPELEAGTSYPIVLTPGFTDQTFVEDWRIWLDIDHNGDFTTNEIIFDTDASNGPVNGMITIPIGANLGVTRMRVIMQFNLASSPCPISNSFGEMEDYCVDITASTVCDSPAGFVATPLVDEALTVSWDAAPNAVSYEADYRTASSVDWISILPTDNSVEINGLDSCASYVLRVKTICPTTQSFGYSTFEFDACPVATRDLLANQALWQVMPNPFQENVNLLRDAEQANIPTQVVIIDALGRVVQQTSWPAGASQLQLATETLTNGLYTLLLYQNGQIWSSRRIIKER